MAPTPNPKEFYSYYCSLLGGVSLISTLHLSPTFTNPKIQLLPSDCDIPHLNMTSNHLTRAVHAHKNITSAELAKVESNDTKTARWAGPMIIGIILFLVVFWMVKEWRKGFPVMPRDEEGEVMVIDENNRGGTEVDKGKQKSKVEESTQKAE